MSALSALLHQHESRTALALWAIVPTVFLFFTLTLAVNPPDHVDRLRVGVAVLDEGVVTPTGPVSIGPRLLEGMQARLGAEPVPFATEGALREAIDVHDVSVGIVVPPGLTEALMTSQPAQLLVVRTDAGDAFGNAFSASLASQLSASLNAVLPALLDGEGPVAPAITVETDTIAASADFRFPALPAGLLLPLWMASVAFAALLATAGDRVRTTFGALRTGLAELTVVAVAAAAVAVVLAADIALFTWRGDIGIVALSTFLWVGLVAIGWLLLGTIRLVGIRGGALLGVIALFVQQPVSGAVYPAAFAPDAVRWLEPIAPLRYLVEGLRTLLIGGSTTADMSIALGVLALAGASLAALGMVRLAATASRRVRRETLATA